MLTDTALKNLKPKSVRTDRRRTQVHERHRWQPWPDSGSLVKS